MTTIKLTGGFLGRERMLVQCDLSQAAAPVVVNYCNGEGGDGWHSTQYQCADARHTTSGLVTLALQIARQACQAGDDDDEPEYEVVRMTDKEAADTVTQIARDIAEKFGPSANASIVRKRTSPYAAWNDAASILTDEQLTDAIYDGIQTANFDD